VYKAAIFDLDGTLLNTIGDIHASLNTALATHGYPPQDRSLVRQMVGHGMADLVKKALIAGAGFGPAELERAYPPVLDSIRDCYLAIPVAHTSHYPGVPEIIADLHSCGTKIAVFTNKLQIVAEKILDHFFPAGFDLILGDEGAFPRKPAPDGVYHILETLAVNASETVFVGDSDTDIRTAYNAGLACIAVSWGFQDPLELIAAGATTICSTSEELRQAIGLHPKA